ncbi:MAG: CHAD domain-containing protein [Nitriliruptoraceae bacterium]
MTSVVFDGGDGPVGPVVEVLAAAGVVLGPPEPLHRTRFDTFDGRLHAAGLRLEARTVATSGDAGHALMVIGNDGPPARLFLSAPLESSRSRPLSLASLPAGPLRGRLQRAAGDRALLAQAALRSVRSSGTVTDDRGIPQAIVHLDTDLAVDPVMTLPAVGLSDGDRAPSPLPAWTVEVEELPGRAAAAHRLHGALDAALRGGDGRAPGRMAGDALERATVAIGLDRTGWRGPQRPDLERREPALVGVRKVLRSFADGLDATWDGAADHIDDEFLHDLRIGVRQTRSLLAQSRGILPKDVRAAQREAFRWLGTVTSPARDLDVYVAGWPRLTSLLSDAEARALEPVLAHLAGQQAVAHSEVALALRSRTARQLRADWRAWLDLPDSEVAGGKHATRPLGQAIGARIMAAQQQLLTHGRTIGDGSPAGQLHELRKDGKRLRYLLEAFGHLGGRKRSKATIGHLKALQDNLGAHQDAEVQAEGLRRALHELGEEETAGTPGEATMAAGQRLISALERQQAEERADFHDRFAAYDQKKARRTLEELVERMSR